MTTRVQAVTSGFYGGIFRTEGDVFDIASLADFSDSSINYQVNGNEVRYGWMKIVPGTTPLLCWVSDAPIPQFPPVDPLRVFVD